MLKAVANYEIDEGVFNDVDADYVTRSLMTIVDGAQTRAVVWMIQSTRNNTANCK